MSKIFNAIVIANHDDDSVSPFNLYTSKFLLPIGQRPAIHYSIKNALLLGVIDIILIVSSRHAQQYEIYTRTCYPDSSIKIVVADSSNWSLGLLSFISKSISDATFIIDANSIIISSNFINRFLDMVKMSDNACVLSDGAYSLNDLIAIIDPVARQVKRFEDSYTYDGLEANKYSIGYYSFNSNLLLQTLSTVEVAEFSNCLDINAFLFSRLCTICKEFNYLELNNANDFCLSISEFKNFKLADRYLLSLLEVNPRLNWL